MILSILRVANVSVSTEMPKENSYAQPASRMKTKCLGPAHKK